MLIRLSRAEVQQHVIGGLLHDLNGPLNNLSLTLALVATAVARGAAAAPADASMTRLARHVATLEAEVRRLADCSQAMGRTLQDESAGDAPELVDLSALVVQVRRRLRHHAALHDILLEEVESADAGVAVRAERDALHFAICALLLGACAACEPDARVALRVARRGEQAIITMTARPAAVPEDVRHALDATVVPPPSMALHVAAGRLVVRAQGGLVSLSFGETDVVIEVGLPATL